MKKDREVLKQGFELASKLTKMLLQACEAEKVPFEAIRRLATPKGRGTLAALAKRIHADWRAEQPKKPVEYVSEEEARLRQRDAEKRERERSRREYEASIPEVINVDIFDPNW